VFHRIGDNHDAREVIASAGEDLEVECVSTGGNPPPEMEWYVGDQRVTSGHRQEDERTDDARTWTSVSRLLLPLSKTDNDASVRCVVKHPAIVKPLEERKRLIVHCKWE